MDSFDLGLRTINQTFRFRQLLDSFDLFFINLNPFGTHYKIKKHNMVFAKNAFFKVGIQLFLPKHTQHRF